MEDTAANENSATTCSAMLAQVTLQEFMPQHTREWVVGSLVPQFTEDIFEAIPMPRVRVQLAEVKDQSDCRGGHLS